MRRSRSLPPPARNGRYHGPGWDDVPEPADDPGRARWDGARARSARAGQEALVLRLAATLKAGQASDLASEVLDRVSEAKPGVGTVILALEGNADIDARCQQALGSLQDSLRMIGVRLRLVAATRHAQRKLQDTGADHCLSPLAVHPSLRSAVLATYAALPGPGLVTAPVRAALDLPAEPLRPRRRITRYGWSARREIAAGLGSPTRTAGGKTLWLT